jgi:hypothetical protein
MTKTFWKVGPITLRWFFKMLVLPSVATYLVVAAWCHLVYLHRCSEARALTDRINAAADVLRDNPKWSYKLIDPQDLVAAGAITEVDGNMVIVGRLTFANFLAPGGRPFAIWTCDDEFGHQEYPEITTRAGGPTEKLSR